MQLSNFDYALPENLIARYPLPKRSASRLLYLPKHLPSQDKQFSDLPHLLNAGDLLVFNDTKVMKARLFGQKSSGGAVEVLVERILESPKFTALCHVRASRSPKKGQLLSLANGKICVQVLDRADSLFILQFEQPILPLLEQYGELPIPPYFNRQANQSDETRYQTVFHNPNKVASVAAPTASLHFDQTMLTTLTNQGIETAFVTLHVGAGTFAPVKTDNILAHKMHNEYAHLPQTTADKIHATQQNGKQVIAVGTTVTRVLETAFQKAQEKNKPLFEWQGDTNIFIYPSYQFGVVDRLITNFHLPKSTLLMLVAAFAGLNNIQQAYQHAIQQQYRFFSYGDAMLLDRI